MSSRRGVGYQGSQEIRTRRGVAEARPGVAVAATWGRRSATRGRGIHDFRSRDLGLRGRDHEEGKPEQRPKQG